MPAAWLEEWFESKGDWFDLVARCYSGICRKGLHTPQFLSYFENELDQENSGVDNAIDGISIAVQNCCCLLGDDRKKSLNAISHCLKGVVLQHSSSSIDRGCLLCWMVIAGIDKAFSDLDVVIDMIEIGPLNNLKKDEVGVYYKAEDSVIKGLLSAYGIKQSPEGRFSERLQIFDLVEKVDSFPLPTIKRLSSNLVNFKKASVIFDAQESCLRIGIAACTCSPLFKKEGQDWIKYKLNKGGALSFQYSQAYEERYDELEDDLCKRL